MISKAMQAIGAFLFIISAGYLIGAPDPARADYNWSTPKLPAVSQRKVFVVETLPAGWPVSSAVRWIDQYTGSKWVMAKRCPVGAYRCIFVKPGNLRAPSLAETYNYSSSRVTIKVDISYARDRVVSLSRRRWVLAHELGHAAKLKGHVASRNNLMHKNVGAYRYGLSASQKAVLRRW